MHRTCTFKIHFIKVSGLHANVTQLFDTLKLKIVHFWSCTREGIDFGSNCVLEKVGFGLKCTLHRVRVPQRRPSRSIQFSGGHPPVGPKIYPSLSNTLLPLFQSRIEPGILKRLGRDSSLILAGEKCLPSTRIAEAQCKDSGSLCYNKQKTPEEI